LKVSLIGDDTSGNIRGWFFCVHTTSFVSLFILVSTMNQQLIQSITQAVIRQLQQNNVVQVPSSEPPSLISQVAQQVVRQSVHQGPVPQGNDVRTPVLVTPVLQQSNVPSSDSLQRSSSGLSTDSTLSRTSSGASVQSAPPRKRTLNFDDLERSVTKKKRRRRRADPVNNAIVDALTRPLMERLDDEFLARPNSRLFKRQLKKTRNPNGTRSLRKRKTMVMRLFRDLVRPIIRNILGRLNTPNASQIYSAYYRVAIKIVTKRRANHVQSWRLRHEPCDHIYSLTERRDREAQQQLDRETQQQLDHETQQRRDREAQQQLDLETQQQLNRETQQRRDRETQQQLDREAQQQLNREAQQQRDREQDVDDNETVDVFRCIDCENSFPQSEVRSVSDDIWGTNVAVRCKQCYRKFVTKNVEPLVSGDTKDKDNIAKAMLSPSKRKRQQENASSRKKKKPIACKWCGATSHKTKRSKKCPHYGKTGAVIKKNKDSVGETNEGVTVEKTANVAAEKTADVAAEKTADVTTEKTVDVTAEKNADVAAEKNTDVAAEKNVDVPTFSLGANVLAKWGRSWYLSHVCGVQGRGEFAVYDVYCPVEEEVKKNLDWKKLRVFENKFVPSRADCVKHNVTFYLDGETWQVRSVHHKINQFRCVRISPVNGTGPNIDNFEIGFVVKQIREEYEQRRERGPKW
jgi:hypothetical protein